MMKIKNNSFTLGKSQLLRLKRIAEFVDECNRIIFDNEMPDDMKVYSIRILLEEIVKDE